MTKAEFTEQQPKIVYGVLGDTYVYLNEQTEEVEQNMGMMDENGETIGEPILVTKYIYDVYTLPNKCQTEVQVLAELKAQRIAELEAFDNGQYPEYGDKAVNDFSISGMHMWLDKLTRNGLDYRFRCEQSKGATETTLWHDTTPITLPIEMAMAMLAQIEVYASACFDRTAAHKQAIGQLTDIDEVINYDFMADYPTKIAL